VILLLLLLPSLPSTAQQGPRPLFPTAPPPAAAPAPPPPLESAPPAPIEVAPLPPPPPAALGLATAESELRGPLWSASIPPDLPLLLQSLPSEVAEPSLRQLQKLLLAAPGPTEPGAVPLLLLRVDRLLAMAEPSAALEVLATVPEGREGVEGRRLLARFAADQVEPACAVAGAEEAAGWPWAQARTLCAALAGDPAKVELGLDLLAARGQPANPAFATLLRAQATRTRAELPSPIADDPLLLPLLRRVPLDLDPSEVSALPPPARRALLANAGLASAVRAAAAPARAGPSSRPELNGTAPGDWMAALALVPPERRAAWAALVDGQGLELPEAVWTALRAVGPEPAAPAPDLHLWRGFELARARQQRGGMLLHVLLLLAGRPEAAAPITLRRALDALVSLDLQPTARVLAAGTGGALGL
jgi:hypothetical protein